MKHDHNRVPQVGEVFKPTDGGNYRVTVFHICTHCEMVFYRPLEDTAIGTATTYDKDIFSFNVRYELDTEYKATK